MPATSQLKHCAENVYLLFLTAVSTNCFCLRLRAGSRLSVRAARPLLVTHCFSTHRLSHQVFLCTRHSSSSSPRQSHQASPANVKPSCLSIMSDSSDPPFTPEQLSWLRAAFPTAAAGQPPLPTAPVDGETQAAPSGANSAPPSTSASGKSKN